ncbi:sigma factor [Sinosporangium siamense]|uniref:Sigma-70 family RNA polymerase sigma factor n=1 Tax=Sinosporangium siamense TaxID=1367973 RepID=A0A919RI76_9ACTN|nr:sigma factor [Sinosporangium siamense]GII94288.1 hypothetical protein Ssi02_45190 [Sinosporangium siamense]
MTPAEEAVAWAHRREWAALIAATVRITRDLDLAEECVQDAYIAALDDWERGGVPERPGAWLTVAARRNALRALRRADTLRSKLHLLVEPEEAGPVAYDDRLRLVFLCCHPALTPEGRVALTLRLVSGVATPDIASTFLVSEPAMAARITRAKKRIAAAGIPFRMPAPAEPPAALDAVLNVIYLTFLGVACGARAVRHEPGSRSWSGTCLSRAWSEVRTTRRYLPAVLTVPLRGHDGLRVWPAGIQRL